MLHKEFTSLVSKYTDASLTQQLWNELEAAYTAEDRYFHNLSHLEQMIAVLQPQQSQIEDWDTLLFAVFYHDAVYDVVQYVTDNNNEDKSAEAAEKALTAIGYPTEKIERCKNHILATKHHYLSDSNDTNLLTDADLSILGQPWDVYHAYMKNIRKEYDVYPDGIYNAGRIKVLKSFLAMNRLFKTEPFFQQFEAAAKENLARELEIISFA